MITAKHATRSGWLIMAIALLVTTTVYWHGLYGSWLFDDYPNIVDNHDLQITDTHLPSLVRAALSSPSSEFKRPLASLSFAANFLIAGLDPFSWKLTNVVIHLLNGTLVFLLARTLLGSTETGRARNRKRPQQEPLPATAAATHAGIVAALIAASWMLLPINLTGVLYVVQRMESLANLFVLTGLLGYVRGRQRMLGGQRGGFVLCIASVLVMTAIGLTAKETAVMLPLYAFLIEWLIFGFARHDTVSGQTSLHRGLIALYLCVLAVPLAIGLVWLLPGLFTPGAWSTRDFTLGTRLLSEARIITDYIGWTLAPTPQALSFYHDDFQVSTGWLTPWTTLASVIFLAALALAIGWLQRRRPLAALGLALYLGCHLLTGTILPLELIYEHRNYFASFGLLLAVVSLLAAPREKGKLRPIGNEQTHSLGSPLPLSLPRYVLLGGLMLLWMTETAFTANAWGAPLTLAQDLATRAPNSPRAQYELGRTYIIYSHYDPGSVFTRLAHAPLERAMALPESSILPEQALIFMNSRIGLPIKEDWWESMIEKLKSRRPGVQDESSLAALAECARKGQCPLPKGRMLDAFLAALSHPTPSARLLATFGDYAWNVLDDRVLATNMLNAAVSSQPGEPAYHITLAHMLAAEGHRAGLESQIEALRALNVGGRLDHDMANLQALVPETTAR
jgi:hypothetical protein